MIYYTLFNYVLLITLRLNLEILTELKYKYDCAIINILSVMLLLINHNVCQLSIQFLLFYWSKVSYSKVRIYFSKELVKNSVIKYNSRKVVSTLKLITIENRILRFRNLNRLNSKINPENVQLVLSSISPIQRQKIQKVNSIAILCWQRIWNQTSAAILLWYAKTDFNNLVNTQTAWC